VGSCLEPEEIAEFVDKNVEEAERQRVMAHLADCQACYETFAAAVRLQETDEAPESVPAEKFEAQSAGRDDAVTEMVSRLPTRSLKSSGPGAAPDLTGGRPTRSRGLLLTVLSAAALVVIAVFLRSAGPPTGEPVVPAPTPAPTPELPETVRTPQLLPANPDAGRRRASDAEITATAVRRDDGGIEISWTTEVRAARYVVRINALDGTPILEREATATDASMTIPAAALAGRAPGERLFVHIEARSAAGANVGASERVEVGRERG